MRRHAVPVTLLFVLCSSLVACGDQGGETTAGAGLEAVSVSGEIGSAPNVTWNQAVEVDELDTEVLVEGEGDPVAADDQVITHVWIGNGFSQRQEFSTYDEGNPEVLTVGDPEMLGAFETALTGARIGSRVLVVAPPADAFGEAGNPNLDIGNEDDVVFILDLTAKVLTEPSGTPVEPPVDAPRVLETDGEPTAIDFSSAATKPPTKLQVIPLVRGDGEPVADQDTIRADYLGQVYRSEQIFDQSFDKQPYETLIGKNAPVIAGWNQALVGQPVGSRVLLVIPPGLAYGDQKQAKIPAGSTLTFVIDILAAY